MIDPWPGSSLGFEVGLRAKTPLNDDKRAPFLAEVKTRLRSVLKSHVLESIAAQVDPVFITSEAEGRLWDAVAPELKMKLGDAYAEALIKGSPVGIRLDDDWTENSLLAHEWEDLWKSSSPRAALRRKGAHTGDQMRFGHFHLTKHRNGPYVHWDFYDVTRPAGLAGHTVYDWWMPSVKRRIARNFPRIAALIGRKRQKTLEEMVVLCGQM